MLDSQGNRVPADPRQSPWYKVCVQDPHIEKPKFQNKFRRRFRLPYLQFLELLAMAEEAKTEDGDLHFRRWMGKDAVGRLSSPLSLMILGALRYLGRGWTFDDIEESTGIGEETHRQFFHIFIAFGKEVLFPKYVVSPSTAEQAAGHMAEMELAGFAGCVGSTDATHIMIERCREMQRQAHLGYKMSHTARTYNATVNHRRRVLSTTTGHPARWNDKTLILFDKFARGIRDGNVLSDVDFELFEKNSNGAVVSVKYRGAWLMVDNGYHNWSTTVPPIKTTYDEREVRWSHWLESLHKDVECTFGILKGRWRILKAGIRLHGIDAPDKVWMTCCALHNWLLEVDGLDDKWEQGVPADWEGELGEHSPADASQFLPNAIDMLHNPVARRAYGSSSRNGRGPDGDEAGDDEEEDGDGTGTEVEEQADADLSVIRVVRNLSMPYFRRKLVEHFDIQFRKGLLQWPSRAGLKH
jgi:hypothetical protein